MTLEPGSHLPDGEDHPFCVALEALAEAIESNFQRHGVMPEPIHLEPTERKGHGSAMNRSSDVPDWAEFIRIDLPSEPGRRRDIIALTLAHLSAARRALPEATWKVTVDERELAWNAEAGFTFAAASG